MNKKIAVIMMVLFLVAWVFTQKDVYLIVTSVWTAAVFIMNHIDETK